MAQPCTTSGVWAQRYLPITTALLAYCRSRSWSGPDPYDALNSEVLGRLGAFESKFVRRAATQLLKRLPWDLRPLLRVPDGQNAKGLALFLKALLMLRRMGILTDETLIDELTERLLQLRSPDSRYWCWGYSFPWQTRTELIMRDAPNVVCTVFVADALLDAHARTLDARLVMAVESCGDYLINELFRSRENRAFFAYPPASDSAIHNASLLAAALLCRSARVCTRPDFVAPALQAARYSVSKQRADGSWPYGDASSQAWIDNFHTGFNLSALRTLDEEHGSPEFRGAARAGLEFYLGHFFLDDGAPRYFHNRTYPIDIHCVSQSILTLADFALLDARCVPTMRRVADWVAARMFDPRGFFYYRQLRFMRNRIPYMRWSQAWMLLALARLLEFEQSSSCPPMHVAVSPRDST
jgi:hypothetical protein